MGKRSRKRRTAGAAAPAARPAAPAAPPAAPARPQRPARPSRSEARNEAARAELEPLEPGERPGAVTVGAFVAIGLVVANVVVYIAGWDIGGSRPALAGFVLFSALMLTMAWGLWKAKYWAVLGLEVLLGILLVFVGSIAFLFSSVTDLLLSLAILIPAGVLFWKLVKAMARIQMPERPGSRR